MPIVHMGDNDAVTFPEGAYCSLSYSREGQQQHGRPSYGLVLYETHHGLCLFESEQNGYNDSDFYMMIWDPVNQKPFQMMFASTRGWTYPCYASHPDATPEVQAAYKAYSEAKARKHRIMSARNERTSRYALAPQMGLVDGAAVARLIVASGGSKQDFEPLKRLLTTNLRSEFRKSLAKQVRDWANDPNPKYRHPLSPRQMSHLY